MFFRGELRYCIVCSLVLTIPDNLKLPIVSSLLIRPCLPNRLTVLGSGAFKHMVLLWTGCLLNHKWRAICVAICIYLCSISGKLIKNANYPIPMRCYMERATLLLIKQPSHMEQCTVLEDAVAEHGKFTIQRCLNMEARMASPSIGCCIF